MSKQMTTKDLEKLLGKKTSTSSEQMTVNDLQKMFTPSQPEQKSAATTLPFSNEAQQKRVLEDFKPMTTNVFEREKAELPFNAPLSSEGLRSKLLEEKPISKADKAKGLDFSTFETTKKETEKESTGPDISNLSPGWQKAVKLARKGNEAIEKVKTTKGTANIVKPIVNYSEGFSNVMEGLGDLFIGKPAGWLSKLGEKTDLEILKVIGDSFNKEFTSYDTSKALRRTSKEMDPHVSKALKDGGFISGFSNLLGSLTVEIPLYLAGQAGAEKLAGAFTKNTQAALVLGQVGSGAKKITTAQKLLNTKRIGGYASRFIASYGRTTSSFLNQGASYEDASKAGKIQGGVSVALNAMTSVLYGAHGDYLIKRLGDKVIVDAEQIVIETLSKQEMILGEVLNWLGVAGVEGLGYVARSYSQHELQKMILNPEMAGYFRNEEGEISLTNAGRDFLIGSVTSAIMQTPSRFKHFNEFKKYQDQLIAESSKAGIATGTKTKLEVSGKGTMEYDPKTGKLKVESTKGILEAQDGHVTKTESRSKVVDATGKDISSDFYKTPNTTRVTFIKELNASKEPNDIKINLIDREINNLNNLVTSGINLEKVNIEDWYDYKQELLSMKDSLLDSSTKEELTSALAGIKMSESSISDVPISPGVVEFKKELLTDKAKVAEKLDKDKKIKINSNKVKVEQEFEENIEDAIKIIDTINKANPQSKPITIVTEHSQDQQTAIDIGSAFGKQVVFVEGSELSGFTTEKNSNVLFIDTKASNALIKSPNSSSLYVLGHELFHSMKGSDSVIFNNFIKEVKKNLTTEQVLNFIELYNPESTLNTVNGLKIDGKINMNELLKNPDKYPEQTQVLDEAVEEMVANEFGGALVSPDFWKSTRSNGKLAELALKTLDTINEPAYDSSLSQLQIDKVKNGFAEIVRSLDKPEEDIKKETVPQTKKIVEKEPELKPELKETKPEPAIIKPTLPTKKEAISKSKVSVEPSKEKTSKLLVKEPVTKTVSKIAEKATGKKPNKTVKSNTIKRISEQRSATTKRMELTKYYEGKDEIIVTDSYSLYSLKKGTEMPIEKGDSKFYDTTLKNLRERVTKNKEEETKVLDIQQIKDNKKNKANIDKYNHTKSGVTFIDSITIDTDKIIDAIRILGTDLKYSTQDDGIPTLFLKNPDGETALILGIKRVDGDTKSKKDTKLPVKDVRQEELKKLKLELNNFNEKEKSFVDKLRLQRRIKILQGSLEKGYATAEEYEKVLKKEESLQKTREDEAWKREFEKTKKEHVLLKEKEDRDYRMTHQPSKDGAPGYDLTNQGGEITIPDDVYDHPENYTGTLGTLGVSRLQENLLRMRNNPNAKVTIYRATTGDTINEGDWVTLNRSYAVEHNKSNLGGKGTILQKTVNAKDIRWDMDDLSEWGYFPVKKDTKLPVKSPIKKATKEDIDHLFGKKQPELPQKTTKEELDLKLDMIKDNFKVFLDFKDRDILNTVIKDFDQYKKEGGKETIPGLDKHMPDKDKTIADWKARLKASGFNIKELPKKQTKLYQSLQNSPNEKVAADIVKLYNEGKIVIDHETQSNPETYEKAMEKLLVDQEGAIHDFFHETNEITPEAVAMGDILLQYYSHIRDLDEMANVWARLHPLGTTTGRTLQMFSNLQKTTPEGYIYIVYKELDKINEILKSSKDPIIRAWIRENAGGIILEDHEQDLLYTMTKTMFGLDRDDFKRNILESQIMKIINDKIPKGWVEKGLTLHRDAMLGNMKTPIRNWMGNVPTLPFNILSQKHVGVNLDKYLSKKTGIRTMGELKNKRKHYLEGIKQAVTDFKLGINTNPTNAFERQPGKAFDDNAHFGKLMNNIDRLVSFNMDVGDRGFFNVYYRGELDAFRELNGGKPPTALQKQIATERAEKLTWKNHGRLYGFARSARNLLNYVHFSDGKINIGFDDMNKGNPVFGIGNAVLPFIMTLANLAVAMYDYSPLSFGSVMLAKHKFDKAIDSGDHEQIFRAQRNLNERLGYAISGTAMWLIGGLLIAASKKSKKFKVTADYDSKVKQLQRDIGWQPYAFQIEDSFYTYSWSEPAGTALGVLAELDRKKAEKLAKGKKLDLFESFLSMLSTMGDSMLEQSYLIALSDLFGRSKYSRMDDGEMEGFARNLRDTAGNAAMQFVPSFVRSLSNYLDSTYKETYEKDAFGKSLSRRILGNIPGLKGTLPSKKNLFGDTAIIGGVKRDPVTRFFNTMLNPANVSKSNYYPEYTELMRIYQTTGTTDFMPREVTNELVYKDKTITLTAKQKTEIQEQMGKIYHKALTGLMRNSIYSDATSFEKAKLLNGLSLYSRDKAIEEVGLFENYELKKGTMAEKIQRYQNSGLSIESALLYHGIINSLDTNSQKAKSIMDMTVSQKEKDIMLSLVSPTTKTSPTSSDLGHLDTDADFDAYYSLSSAKREQHSNYGKHFNIKADTFASAIKDISKIESKKDATGKTIPNSKRDQVKAYIEKLPNLNAAQKLYLYNTVGYTINTKANSEIMHKYIESLSLSAKDKLEIWKALGFK